MIENANPSKVFDTPTVQLIQILLHDKKCNWVCMTMFFASYFTRVPLLVGNKKLLNEPKKNANQGLYKISARYLCEIQCHCSGLPLLQRSAIRNVGFYPSDRANDSDLLKSHIKISNPMDGPLSFPLGSCLHSSHQRCPSPSIDSHVGPLTGSSVEWLGFGAPLLSLVPFAGSTAWLKSGTPSSPFSHSRSCRHTSSPSPAPVPLGTAMELLFPLTLPSPFSLPLILIRSVILVSFAMVPDS
jgi:hypothetical protein